MADVTGKTQSLASLCETIIECRRCPRLVAHRETVAREKRAAFRAETYWGRPLPGFGDPAARLLIVGLAPAAHGGNRTGRIFTGDSSGTFLMQGLHKGGFASKPDSVSRDDGLVLHDAYIVAAARCAPPDNKPLPEEIVNCRPFLLAEAGLLPNVKAVLALGRIAFDSYRAALASTGLKLTRQQFAHAGEHDLGDDLPRMFASYHPSRQNTQTGRLTAEMFAKVIYALRDYLNPCG